MLNDMATDSFVRRAEARQNRIQSFAFIIAVSVCVLLSVCFATSNLSESGQPYKIELDGQINPNDAAAASLIRLPGIGVTRAAAIVAYRDNVSGQDGDELAFRDCDDLQKVKGIGPKTVQNICEWLKFE